MRWFANLRSMMKLITGFGVVSIIVAVVGTVGLSKMADITAKARVISSQGLDGLAAIEDAHLDFVSHDRALFEAAATGDAVDIDELAADLRYHRTAFDHGLQNVEILVDDADTSQRLAQVRTRWEAYAQVADAVLEAMRSGDPQAVRSTLASAAAAAEPLDEEIDALARDRQRRGQAAFTEAQAAYESSQMTMIVLVLVAVVASALIGIAIGRMVSRPLVQAARVLSRVAEGDFTRRLDVDTRDEVGTMAVALNSAIGDVSSALQEVRLSAYAVSAASSELSSASQDISNGAQEQASSIEESASSLEQLTSTLRHNAERAQQANMAALTSRDVAEKGGESVVSAVAAMDEINRASKRISEIITAIDEIAFQTNLLALNAAVEAARAGEQGRGFAVVASEVRNLAQRSATAAREIKSLIDDSVEKIEKGTELVTESGQTLEAIIVSVKQVSDIVAEIASASREQAAGIEQVSRAVSQMDHVTQSNAAQTEELSGTAESLAAQSHHLKALVSRFQLDHGGPAEPDPAARPAPPARPSSAGSAAPSPAAADGSAKPSAPRPATPSAARPQPVAAAPAAVPGPRHGDDLDAFFEEV